MSEIPGNNTQEMSTFAYALLENYWHIEGWHSGEVTHWMPIPQPPEDK